MTDITFKYGSLIRTGPKLATGGKWDATLDEFTRNAGNNADLTIYISVYFQRIDPAGPTGLYGDNDDTPANPSKRRIQRWKPGEFDTYTQRLVAQAQRFWNGAYWLQTPDTYSELNWPETRSTHRCNVYCKCELSLAGSQKDAHYTIAVVRAQDGEKFRSNSGLYSQKDIDSKQMIPSSTSKFWTHFHEVGHLLGLGHVGTGGHVNLHGDNSPTAYGVTQAEMLDVMGRGSVRHLWHALPWQEAAEAFTGVNAANWKASMRRIPPKALPVSR